MAKFRTSASTDSSPESITAMFLDLTRDPSIKFLYGHQETMLNEYQEKHLKKTKDSLEKTKDLAIELPTGTGKTLVGLLIAEYRRRAFNERVVFLCPTRQLCAQVNEKARLYGIKTALLIGSQREYDQSQFYAYQQSKVIAITTYSGIFNTNPKIDDPNIIVCDDAHAADNYVVSLWTLSIDRVDHKNLFDAVVRTLDSAIPEFMNDLMKNNNSGKFDRAWVDLVSNIACYEVYSQLKETIEGIISQYQENEKYKKLKYSWKAIESHLDVCSIYCSQNVIEIRPLIPPTLTHNPFSQATQRIYMSATLGDDGDIERVFGVKHISRLPIPSEWHKRSTGRRLVLFPTMSSNDKLNNSNSQEVVISMLTKVPRALITVSDNATLEKWSNKFTKTHTVFKAEDIEQSLEPFIKCGVVNLLFFFLPVDMTA
jgi:Rad3-related DNA helicase